MVNDSSNIAEDNDNSNSHNFNRNEDHKTYFWKEVSAYEKIIHWKRNFVYDAKWCRGKNYIEEITRLLKLWISKLAVEGNCT